MSFVFTSIGTSQYKIAAIGQRVKGLSEGFENVSNFAAPNILVERLTLTLRIREVPGANVGP
jgi:hypothetical protein